MDLFLIHVLCIFYIRSYTYYLIPIHLQWSERYSSNFVSEKAKVYNEAVFILFLILTVSPTTDKVNRMVSHLIHLHCIAIYWIPIKFRINIFTLQRKTHVFRIKSQQSLILFDVMLFAEWQSSRCRLIL